MQPKRITTSPPADKIDTLVSCFIAIIFLLMFTNRVNAQGKCLIVSDIHFNPFVNTTEHFSGQVKQMLADSDVSQWRKILDSFAINSIDSGLRGHDTDYPLLISAMQNMKQTIDRPDFIVISGDFIWHEGPSDGKLKQKTIQFIAGLFHDAFPHVPIIPALGNNDADSDYSEQSDAFLTNFANAWKLTDLKINNDTFVKNGGYYTASVGQLKFIVLNTSMVSLAAANRGYNYYHDGFRMLHDFMTPELSDTSKPVWIISHIPPGLIGYNHQKMWDTTNGANNLTSIFTNLVSNNHHQIRFMVAAHTHMNDFKVFYKGQTTNPQSAIAYMRIVPSISPNHKNNPSFEVAEFDKDFHVTRETNYYLDLATSVNYRDAVWGNTFSLNNFVGNKGITPKTLSELVDSMSSNHSEIIRKKYNSFYEVGYPEHSFIGNANLSDYLKAEGETGQ